MQYNYQLVSEHFSYDSYNNSQFRSAMLFAVITNTSGIPAKNLLANQLNTVNTQELTLNMGKSTEYSSWTIACSLNIIALG